MKVNPKPAVNITPPKAAVPVIAPKAAVPAPKAAVPAPKAAVVPPKIASVVAPKTSNPAPQVTGQVTFGRQADTKAQLPILIVLGAVAVLLFRGGLFRTGSRRK